MKEKMEKESNEIKNKENNNNNHDELAAVFELVVCEQFHSDDRK